MSEVLRMCMYAFVLILDALIDSLRDTILLKKGLFMHISAQMGMRIVWKGYAMYPPVKSSSTRTIISLRRLPDRRSLGKMSSALSMKSSRDTFR